MIDVVVVGGGVIGLSVARELALRGLRVRLLERGTPAREASWAAAGMLSPLGEAVQDPALLHLGDVSLRLWPEFAAALRAASGVDPDFRMAGKLHVARTAEEADELERMARAGDAFGAKLLDAAELRAEEPALAEDVTRGLHIERDHSVDPRRLGHALWAAAIEAGVDLRLGSAVAGVRIAKGTATGVTLPGGDVLHADAVVVAAGAWSGEITGLPTPLPVRPVRGEMFAVDAGGLLSRVVQGACCYFVPRAGGQLAIGATAHDVGFRRGPTPAGIAGLVGSAAELVPAIAQQPLLETWAGFRPATPDERPILGEDPDARRLFHATGHYRNGILFAPATARIVADAITGGAPLLDAAPFGIARLRAA